jgi:UDP-N-acetylmuramate--alanine ligase
MKLKVGQHIHLVGIGGSGLSAIARILLGQGYKVSGSDRSLNSLTEALARDGATIYEGHDASYIKGADALIITSAVKPDHIEVTAAREQGIPVYKRQDIIADLMEGKTVIAVAGTKGKTTTTSMIVHILRECGLDPSYIVGGILGNTGTNAGVGTGNIFVVEADEYDNMFLGLKPDIAVITNIEWDHPDFFASEEALFESFRQFLNLIPDNGAVVFYSDHPKTHYLVFDFLKQKPMKYATTYGDRDDFADVGAQEVRLEGQHTRFSVIMNAKGLWAKVADVRLNLPGRHNIQNALAACIVANLLSIGPSFPKAATALESFKSTARRFEIRADVGEIAVVDDYAHNPMSIRAVLEAARQRYPGRTIWAVWQPHTFSRTQALMPDYVKAFDAADHVLVTDIYAARESPIEGVTSAAVVKAMKHPDARHTATFEDTVKVLSAEVKAPAVILIMSAGDAPQIGIEYLKRRG